MRLDSLLLAPAGRRAPVAALRDLGSVRHAEKRTYLFGISCRALSQYQLPTRRPHDCVGQIGVDGTQASNALIGDHETNACIARSPEKVGQVASLVTQQPRLIDNEKELSLPARGPQLCREPQHRNKHPRAQLARDLPRSVDPNA